MATKKQKRERMQMRREAFEANERELGLKAQRMDRKRREQKELDDWEKQHNAKHSWKNRVTECPHCRAAMSQSA